MPRAGAQAVDFRAAHGEDPAAGDGGVRSGPYGRGWYQALSYVLVITGWILATTVVAGVTRTVSRQ